ncbi:Crp/Fnr family transcriptional regulator [Wenzhouxiangella limi]|uniref:Crp/Fnr family transcriptional regulator n=1 Tax=Wenzhouxiangella limi TaxID=2707351 RepID=A0A845V6B4_9GAMM|nr:Crp/Fnr family transcriptional regulator [Wenzhouxiangella limi]NDY95731.1 Crp/Fnr family transcriptional regulator [Wenzhouxiangella limi]
MDQQIDGKHLKDSFLGEELDDADIKSLQSVMTIKTVAKDEFLAREGSTDRHLYLLADGGLEVLTLQHGEPTHIYAMAPGEFAGTRAFVDGTARSASLKAQCDSVVYCLEPGPFETLLESNPVLVYKIMRAIFRITHLNLMRMNREAQELANYVYKIGGRY